MLSYDQFNGQLKKFTSFVVESMNNAEWFADAKPQLLSSDQFFIEGPEDRSSLFVPFVQKIIVDAKSKVFVIADIHGDIGAISSILKHARETGYLSEDNKVLLPNVYFVFLGDYVNRGAFGVDVVSLLIDLYLKNKNSVFLLRGNHEYAWSNKRFDGRHATVEATLGQTSSVSFLQQISQRFGSYTYPDLLYWYDCLPMALYLGSTDANGKTSYIKFCHAGLEIGDSQAEFLADLGSVFKYITVLNRSDALALIIKSGVIPNIAQQIEKSEKLVVDEECMLYRQSYSTDAIDLSRDSRPCLQRIGMQWNNFTTEEESEVQFALSSVGRNIYVGRVLAQYLFDRASTQFVQLVGVMRGHQHLDEEIPAIGLKTTMMTRIKKDKGLVKQWDGMVYTLGATASISGYQSFAIVTIDNKHNFESVRHYFKTPESRDFSMRMMPMN